MNKNILKKEIIKRYPNVDINVIDSFLETDNYTYIIVHYFDYKECDIVKDDMFDRLFRSYFDKGQLLSNIENGSTLYCFYIEHDATFNTPVFVKSKVKRVGYALDYFFIEIEMYFDLYKETYTFYVNKNELDKDGAIFYPFNGNGNKVYISLDLDNATKYAYETINKAIEWLPYKLKEDIKESTEKI